MAEYQNIFTQVQVRGPGEAGVPIGRDEENRTGGWIFNRLAGAIGNAQLGPIYLEIYRRSLNLLWHS